MTPEDIRKLTIAQQQEFEQPKKILSGDVSQRISVLEQAIIELMMASKRQQDRLDKLELGDKDDKA